eukprot:GHVP01055278.1.p1 GENE.GHVP01055278.1~~GHVP01055278.1.p1  ORF type:complete len:629 (+),score=109.51 GHVP01055278.1:765-2651(+)
MVGSNLFYTQSVIAVSPNTAYFEPQIDQSHSIPSSALVAIGSLQTFCLLLITPQVDENNPLKKTCIGIFGLPSAIHGDLKDSIYWPNLECSSIQPCPTSESITQIALSPFIKVTDSQTLQVEVFVGTSAGQVLSYSLVVSADRRFFLQSVTGLLQPSFFPVSLLKFWDYRTTSLLQSGRFLGNKDCKSVAIVARGRTVFAITPSGDKATFEQTGGKWDIATSDLTKSAHVLTGLSLSLDHSLKLAIVASQLDGTASYGFPHFEKTGPGTIEWFEAHSIFSKVQKTTLESKFKSDHQKRTGRREIFQCFGCCTTFNYDIFVVQSYATSIEILVRSKEDSLDCGVLNLLSILSFVERSRELQENKRNGNPVFVRLLSAIPWDLQNASDYKLTSTPMKRLEDEVEKQNCSTNICVAPEGLVPRKRKHSSDFSIDSLTDSSVEDEILFRIRTMHRKSLNFELLEKTCFEISEFAAKIDSKFDRRIFYSRIAMGLYRAFSKPSSADPAESPGQRIRDFGKFFPFFNFAMQALSEKKFWLVDKTETRICALCHNKSLCDLNLDTLEWRCREASFHEFPCCPVSGAAIFEEEHMRCLGCECIFKVPTEYSHILRSDECPMCSESVSEYIPTFSWI